MCVAICFIGAVPAREAKVGSRLSGEQRQCLGRGALVNKDFHS